MTEDETIRHILATCRSIAVVGWSPRPDRASHGVAALLASRGYRVIPVNPGHAGKSALGATIRSSLAEVAEKDGPVDMVDVFRRSEEAGAVVDEAIAIGARAVWLQLGVTDDAALARARAVGLLAVQDRCPAIELRRLST
ncbi:MAG: CoA-binding protein [Paracoccaceae bacterium]